MEMAAAICIVGPLFFRFALEKWILERGEK
jgi:hypothetical protein